MSGEDIGANILRFCPCVLLPFLLPVDVPETARRGRPKDCWEQDVLHSVPGTAIYRAGLEFTKASGTRTW
jgi:hypothetical protein